MLLLLLAAGSWQLAAGRCWLLVQVAGFCLLLAAGLAAACWPAVRLLPAVGCWLLVQVAGCSLAAAWLLAARWLFVRLVAAAGCWLLGLDLLVSENSAPWQGGLEVAQLVVGLLHELLDVGLAVLVQLQVLFALRCLVHQLHVVLELHHLLPCTLCAWF